MVFAGALRTIAAKTGATMASADDPAGGAMVTRHGMESFPLSEATVGCGFETFACRGGGEDFVNMV